MADLRLPSTGNLIGLKLADRIDAVRPTFEAG